MRNFNRFVTLALAAACIAVTGTPVASADPVDDAQALHDHVLKFYEEEVEAWIDCIDGCFPPGPCMMNPIPGHPEIC